MVEKDEFGSAEGFVRNLYACNCLSAREIGSKKGAGGATGRRKEKVIGTARLTVSVDGKALKEQWEDKLLGTDGEASATKVQGYVGGTDDED